MTVSWIKRSGPLSTETSKKRRRIEDPNKRLLRHPLSEAAPLSVDQLAWREVALPDRFEDAEGFFGLEEIENVEVVKHPGSKEVQYRFSSSLSRANDSSTQVERSNDLGKSRSTQVNEEDDLSWEGFQDDEEVGMPSASRNENQEDIDSGAGPTAGTPEKKLRSEKHKSVTLKQDSMKNKNAFEALYDTAKKDVDVSAWLPLGLSSETLVSLAKLRFARPTPIQSSTIPEILQGHDVVGKASTGSGKTLAFGIPILEHYLARRSSTKSDSKKTHSRKRPPPIAMILSPTRELAHQLSAHISDLCTNIGALSPRVAVVTGGLSLQKQHRLLANADIIIGTPGRLWEVISGGKGLLKWLQQLKYLVVDEADRLLSEGNFKEVVEILDSLDRVDDENHGMDDDEESSTIPHIRRQTLVFSATFQKELQRKLAGKGKFSGGDLMDKQESIEYLLKKLKFREEKPKFIDVNPASQMASGLREGVIECAGLDKDLYLYALLLHHPIKRTLIFTNSISAVRRLTPFLQHLDLPAHAIHSQMAQKARLRAVERFSATSQTGSILIATDIAARGLDIPSVELVVHYHLPRTADMYVHRSGRTARADKTGLSILLCAPEEVQGVRRLVAKVHARIVSPRDEKSKKLFMQTIDLDRRLVARLRPRVTLSKKISDSFLAKEKKNHNDNWLKTAANDLGVEYDSEEFNVQEGSKKGRGQGRLTAERESRALSKLELAGLKDKLKAMLNQRVNTGVSETYLSAGGIDMDELLRQDSQGHFLGNVNGMSL